MATQISSKMVSMNPGYTAQVLIDYLIERKHLSEGAMWMSRDNVVPDFIAVGEILFQKYMNLGITKTMACETAVPINLFLLREGFEIKLEPWEENQNQVGCASVTELLLKWKATPCVIKNTWKGVTIDVLNPVILPKAKMATNVEVWQNGQTCIVKLPKAQGQEKYSLYFVVGNDFVGDNIAEGQLYSDKILGLLKKATKKEYAGVCFPETEFSYRPEISPLFRNLYMANSPVSYNKWFVSQAVQEVQVKIDPIGFSVKDAVAISTTRGGADTSKHLIIDVGYSVLVTHDDLTIDGKHVPLFVGHVGDDWFKLNS